MYAVDATGSSGLAVTTTCGVAAGEGSALPVGSTEGVAVEVAGSGDSVGVVVGAGSPLLQATPRTSAPISAHTGSRGEGVTNGW
jgi:hypothetical protein